MNCFVNNVSFLPELCRCDDLDQENKEEVNSEKDSSSSEGLPEGHQGVDGVIRGRGDLASVIPSVILGPVDILIEAVEGNLVIRAHEASLGVVESRLERDLLPLPVMQDVEQPETGDEQ